MRSYTCFCRIGCNFLALYKVNVGQNGVTGHPEQMNGTHDAIISVLRSRFCNCFYPVTRNYDSVS